MRVLAAIAVLCALSCTPRPKSRPPSTRFYFPSAVHFQEGPPGTEGTLYVVSANFDRRYDTGLLSAIALDNVGLPAFGDPYSGPPKQIIDLKVDGGEDVVALASFGTDFGVLETDAGSRMFIPSRAEGQKLMVVNGQGTTLTCIATLTSDGGVRPTPVDPRDCGEVGASLVEEEKGITGVPRADSPMAATVSPSGIVWVTSGRQSDSPRFSQMMLNDYVVRMPAGKLQVEVTDFLPLGPGSTHGVVSGKRWTYFSGRFPATITNPPLLRMLDDRVRDGGYTLLIPSLESDVRVTDGRGIAISSDEKHIFIAGRVSGASGNDRLVIASISDPLADLPTVSLNITDTDKTALGADPQMVKVLPRGPGLPDLVLIACAGAGALQIYDFAETRRSITTVNGVGLQPSSVAYDLRDTNGVKGARVFVTNFGDGRVAVVDIPDLERPDTAFVVAHLGDQQVCLTARNQVCDAGQ